MKLWTEKVAARLDMAGYISQCLFHVFMKGALAPRRDGQ